MYPSQLVHPSQLEIKCKETFEKRKLTTEPKFLQKKRTTALSYSHLENMSTFENDKEEKM